MYTVYALLRKGRIVYIGIKKKYSSISNYDIGNYDNIVSLHECKSFSEAQDMCLWELNVNSFLEDK